MDPQRRAVEPPNVCTDYALITDAPARGPAAYLSFLLLSSFAPLRLICGYLKRSMKIIEENRIMGKIADLIQLETRMLVNEL